MKISYLITIILVLFILSCQSNNENSAENKTEDLTQSPIYNKGVQLIAQSDCLTCHTVAKPITGPSYKEVAIKYEYTTENVNYLVEKIIKGGKGNWGQIPMTPHPNLSVEDAKTMVEYIFLFKK